ncbi:MAG: methyltransferase domain-containing protein [Rhizobiales bacterium]|nr:methyltransferase domain-containing protein [Hyphomicrobiales bacterium]
MVAILGFNRDQIFSAVRQMYSEVAAAPATPFHFPVGRKACLFVGYPKELIDGVPDGALESFAGVGCPFRANIVKGGDRVLDIGAGSGTDTLIAARLVGAGGKVWAIDMTPAMVFKLRRNIAAAGATNIEVLEGNAELIPLPDASVDVVTSNGVLNLVPDKARAVAEIFRVLQAGGRVQIADIVLSRPVGEERRGDAKLWAECVVGATVDEDYLDLFRSVGFAEVIVLRRYDYFSASASADTRRIAAVLGGRAAEITMRKPMAPRSAFSVWAERLRPNVLARRAAQHGLIGLFTSVAAVAACYGVLALVVALGFLGLSAPINEQLWTGLIAAFAILAAFALAWNQRVHRSWLPAIVGATGALLVLYALLGTYDWRIEAAGFAALIGAALWDRYLFRRAVNC